MGRTLAEKVWDDHVVRRAEGEPDLLFIDLHLLHEVTSPQAFDGLRMAGRQVRRLDLTIATEDHNTPTLDIDKPIADPVSRAQLETLRKNCAEFGVRLHPLGDVEQGVVHVVGPQLGLTQPGTTVVCGDSPHLHPRRLRRAGVRHRHQPGRARAGHPDAAAGPPQDHGDHRRRRAARRRHRQGPDPGDHRQDRHRRRPGLRPRVPRLRHREALDGGPDDHLQHVDRGRRPRGHDRPGRDHLRLPEGPRPRPQGEDWDAAVAYWKTLRTDDDAVFDAEVVIDAAELAPFVTWGTNPGQGAPLSASVPDPASYEDASERLAAEKALEYMGLTAGQPLREIKVDTVFVGSCTNGRIEDLRAAAAILEGRKVADGVRMLVVPGSVRVALQAVEEGLDKVFTEAGAEWRHAGCSMCLGMNPDQLAPGERSASTSNRNFEGRQGKGGRTHLVSPQVAAATAVLGHLASPADLSDADRTPAGV